MASQQIAPEVVDVLRSAVVDGATLKLTGQLTPKLYKSVNDVIARLGGKWNRSSGLHIFPKPVAEALDGVLDSGVKPLKNPAAFFPTPDALVARMVAALDMVRTPNATVLEPSAGDGRIVAAVLAAYPECGVTWVEIDEDRADLIPTNRRAKGYRGDFLAWPPAGKALNFDFVIMNPPFAVPGNKDAFIDHVEHAYAMLRPGGRLVAIVPESIRTRTTKSYTRLRTLFESQGSWEDVDAGTFKESGTGVNTIMVTVDKPAAETKPKTRGKAVTLKI
jgi:predicted RNA methylase